MTVTRSKYTDRANEVVALYEADGPAANAEVFRELLEAVNEARRLSNERLAADQSYEAKRSRLWATNSEKLIGAMYDFAHGLSEWAPGGKYATPEYLARLAESKKVPA